MKNSKRENKKIIDEVNFGSIFNPLYLIILIISSLFFAFAIQLNMTFSSTTFERIIYNLINMDNINMTAQYLTLPALKVSSSFIIILCISILPLLFRLFFCKKIFIDIFNKKILVYPISIKWWSLSLLGISFSLILMTLRAPEFIFNNLNYTNLYEEYYVKYNKDKIKFPQKKRNLVTIYVESFENSVFSIENGGVNKESYMPKIEAMTSKYINFSNNGKIGGFYSIRGTDWTAAALVAQTSGIPIYINTKNNDNKFLEGAISIGDILEDNGYKNYFLMGSDAKFAERKKYFLEHGNYDITDYVKAKEKGLISNNYYSWWGFEDKKLYSFAQDILLEISKNDEPFNFSILTADTHFYDGYNEISCPKKFDTNYANSYYCTDHMLTDFIDWIQTQDFYNNTTIVIIGDHISMRDDFFDISDGYYRSVYNLFINSYVNTDNTKNRLFSSFDIYPTTLASIGASIEGDRLALGTNLFSDKKTLMEEFGKEEFEKEVTKISKYYNREILKN